MLSRSGKWIVGGQQLSILFSRNSSTYSYMDPEDFLDLMTTHQASLYRYAKFLGRDSIAARRVIHDAFVRAYYDPRPPALSENQRVYKWLRGFVREIHIEISSRGLFGLSKSELKSIEGMDRFWDKNLALRDDFSGRLTLLSECLDEMPASQKRFLEKFYRAKFSEKVDESSKNVKEPSRVRSIRAALVKCVARRQSNTSKGGVRKGFSAR